MEGQEDLVSRLTSRITWFIVYRRYEYTCRVPLTVQVGTEEFGRGEFWFWGLRRESECWGLRIYSSGFWIRADGC